MNLAFKNPDLCIAPPKPFLQRVQPLPVPFRMRAIEHPLSAEAIRKLTLELIVGASLLQVEGLAFRELTVGVDDLAMPAGVLHEYLVAHIVAVENGVVGRPSDHW